MRPHNGTGSPGCESDILMQHDASYRAIHPTRGETNCHRPTRPKPPLAAGLHNQRRRNRRLP